MSTAKSLRMGADTPAPSRGAIKRRKEILRDTIVQYLPEIVKAVDKVLENDPTGKTMVMLHQDGFASQYDDDEYTLLGMAIKYAGLQGVSVCIAGRNGETIR